MKTKFQIGQLLEFLGTNSVINGVEERKVEFGVIDGIIQKKDSISYLMQDGRRVNDDQIKNVYVPLAKPRTRVRRKAQPENPPDLPG